MAKLTYYAVIEAGKAGYGIFFPDVPGCVSCGDDIEHARSQAKEALSLHFHDADLSIDGIPQKKWDGNLDSLPTEYSDVKVETSLLVSVDL